MKLEDFDFGNNDHLACLYAAQVRNALEDLHAGDGPIDDGLMMAINKRVRRSIWQTLEIMDHQLEPQLLMVMVASIPRSWEMPSTLSERDGIS